MATSLACRAIFSSILLAGLPECEISNFPMRAAAETLLKIGVDIDKNTEAVGVVPSTERFLEMMHWRRDVNLAQAYGLPCDSESQLYAEYSSNLYAIATNGLVRLTMDLLVEYRSTLDGSFSQEQIVTMPKLPALRGANKIKTVNAAEEPCDDSASGSSNSVVGEERTRQSTKDPEDKDEAEAFTTTANVTSNATQTTWSQARAAVVAAMLAMLVLA